MNAEENDILQIYFNQVNTKEFSDRDMIINNSLLKSKIKRLVYINELDKYEFVNARGATTNHAERYWREIKTRFKAMNGCHRSTMNYHLLGEEMSRYFLF